MRVDPVEGMLVVDVGNSRIALGIWDDDGLHDVQRLPAADSERWPEALEDAAERLQPLRSRALVIASVASRRARALADLAEQITRLEPLFVRDDIPLPMPCDIENVDQVGVDRVCCAAAAYERIGSACAVASFGTAITIDCVSDEGHFLGGTILAGLDMSLEALHSGTAELPRVSLESPDSPFGRNTEQAIRAGVVYGALGALREIVERFATQLGRWPPLVITGGNAPLIATLADFVDAHVPDLSLLGVALAYRKAAGQM